MPQLGSQSGIARRVEGYGAAMKDTILKEYGCTVGLSGRGEMIPNEDSYCEIDKNGVDKWGTPTLRFHWKWSDAEVRQVKHMQETFRSIIDDLGGRALDPMPGPDEGYGISKGGEIIHEAGTTRMGTSPRTSVLNEWCQAHEVKNLFVADAGPFVSNAHKNVTWTILALAWRTSEHIADERRKGNL